MPDFSSLLSRPMDEVKAPVPLPAGTYTGVVKSYQTVESSKKKTPGVEFTFALTGAGDDIDADDLVDAAGVPLDLSKKAPNYSFWLTPDAEYMLKQFIESCGIPTEGRTFAETIPETINQPVLISLSQRTSEDGERVFNDVQRVTGEAA